MTAIRICALDTLFFKDGRPFVMGEETWANGVFPPYPSVFYGAMRAVYFAENLHAFPSRETVNDPTSTLQIRSLALQIKFDDYITYYPLPYDCVRPKNSNDNFFSMQLRENKTISNYPCDFLLLPGEYSSNQKVEHLKDGLLDCFSLERYLRDGQVSNHLPALALSDILTLEPKVGIARDKNMKTTKKTLDNDGMLYRMDMRRMETDHVEACFIIVFEGLNLPEDSLMRLGAEGKGAYYINVDGDDCPDIKISWNGKEEVFFKVYLSTPAIFDNGWYPGWIKASDGMSGTFQGLKLKLIAAAVGNYLPIGGFDMKRRKPKPMRRAVPAGSVYYFKLLAGDPRSIMETFHNKAISDDFISNDEKDREMPADYYRRQGFGISFLGVV